VHLYFIGSGVDIYVFSEGIDYDHEKFKGRAFDGGYKRLNPGTGQPENCSSTNHRTRTVLQAWL